jgi:ribonucleoside-diphosphate reductase alpha chain
MLGSGYTLSFAVGPADGTLTTVAGPDGGLREVFLRVDKQGSTLGGLTDALATSVSTALHHGVPLSALTDEFRGTHFPPSGATDDPEIPWSPSVVDYLSRRLTRDYP